MEFQSLDRLRRYIFKDGKNGAPLATLFAQVALFAASWCLQETRLCSEYDHSGIKPAILYHVCSVLLCYTNRLSRLGFFRKSCGVKVNSMANFIWLILAILLEKFNEKSLASLCFALAMTILFLILLVIIHPSTDLGFLGFLIGVTGSVAYNLFQLKLGTWIVVAICFVLCAFKFWLDENWLELEVAGLGHDNSFSLPIYLTSINSRFCNPFPAAIIQRIDALIVAGFYLVWASSLSINCLNSESCTSCSAMKKLKCGVIYILWLSPAHIHRVYYSLKSPKIVLKVHLHCEDCASSVTGKVAGVLKQFEGVERAATDIKAITVVLKGKEVDPMKVCETLQRTSGEKVDLISPLLKPPKKKKEEGTTMVLDVDLHCPKCYKKVIKLLCKFPEIQDQVYDVKGKKLTITVVCRSPEKIRDKLCCKGGRSIASNEIFFTVPLSP